MRRTQTTGAALIAAALLLMPPVHAARTAADDLLTRSKAAYAALKSYADTGTAMSEGGSSGASATDRLAFKTYYRSPRLFYFDIMKGAKGSGGRFVIWSDADAFHTWWSATGVEDEYPRGTGAAAFTTGAGQSGGFLMYIAPLLFPQAGLAGTFTDLGETQVMGVEAIGGQPCHKITGVAKSVYAATGHEFAVRKVTVWIDQQTLLIRKVFEDTPRGLGASAVARVTVTFEPQANPTLDDAKFKFTVPGGPQ